MGKVAVYIGLYMTCIAAVAGPYIGKRRAYWTPGRIRWWSVIVYLPLGMGLIVKSMIDGAGVIEKLAGAFISVLIMLVISLILGLAAARFSTKEPFKSMYHVRFPGQKENQDE